MTSGRDARTGVPGGDYVEFGWDESELRLKAQLEAFVSRWLPQDWDRSPASLGTASPSIASQNFSGRLAEAGLLVRSWPEEHGGEGATVWEQLILAEVMWEFGEPRGPQYMNVNWIGPTIMRFGTEDQKRQHLPAMAEGRVIWCQGFSEPDAGSDLLALRTTAHRQGHEFVINGQKVWTSYASSANYCFLLARTGPREPRQGGLSVFLVPMDTPGIEVRKIEALVGGHAFHEVFLTEVRVPDSSLLGVEGEGLKITREVLSLERVGLPRYIRAEQVLDALARWAATRETPDGERVYRRLGEALAACEAARLLVYQVADERSKGLSPSASVHLARAAIVEAERLVGDVALDIMEEESTEIGSLADSSFRNSLAVGVASGTYEMQLNQIARTLLQLPRA